MAVGITFRETPDEDERRAILEILVESNLRRGPAPQLRPFAFVLRDGDGPVQGGLWGRTAYDWAVVELLVVPEALRGQGVGRDLIARAEALARARGCRGIWLDTFGFQAPGFYQGLGYEVFGRLPENPRGHDRVFLRKMLA
ncbi:GNAT family N-acetyltransferase [Frigidibacter sp. MR17.24]|uniref:GNAT family N-acetyltransferase n=1 Tax=Frigidibacter sp. MR17.24 TaxID=3127345 RepID=UPI003012F2EE